jgi:hypothetical protein
LSRYGQCSTPLRVSGTGAARGGQRGDGWIMLGRGNRRAGFVVEPPVGIEPTTFSLRRAFVACSGDSQRLRTSLQRETIRRRAGGCVRGWGQHGDSANDVQPIQAVR